MKIDEKLIIAKLMDQIRICKTRNKIVNSAFLTIYQKEIIIKELNKNKIKNYFFFGGYEGAEGEILIIYPEKLGIEIAKKNLEKIIKAIQIILPKELEEKYTHRDYLGAVMKAGLNRDRIGDIIVHPNKAYIVVLDENSEYIVDSLKELTRFNKAEIQVINYDKIDIKELEFEESKISVSSMRLDNVIAEIVKTSRSKAEELLLQEKIFLNSKNETKSTKIVKENDILAIRGNGKYIIDKIIGTNKRGKILIQIKKYK